MKKFNRWMMGIALVMVYAVLAVVQPAASWAEASVRVSGTVLFVGKVYVDQNTEIVPGEGAVDADGNLVLETNLNSLRSDDGLRGSEGIGSTVKFILPGYAVRNLARGQEVNMNADQDVMLYDANFHAVNGHLIIASALRAEIDGPYERGDFPYKWAIYALRGNVGGTFQRNPAEQSSGIAPAAAPAVLP